MIAALARKFFGSSNDRRIRTYQPRVDAINALEKELEKLSDDQLRAHFESDGVELWVLFHGDEAAGFFELQRHTDGSVEIVYFGLTSAFFGKGLGKHLLTKAAESAWAMGATRVWLHTCTLDSPAALPNYLARGFSPYRTETYEASIADAPPA